HVSAFVILPVLLHDRVQNLPAVVNFFWKLIIYPKVGSFKLPCLALDEVFMLVVLQLGNDKPSLCTQ
ncbi:hypothetical protein LDENG_00270880, partial [Lucifuga dentata]